MSRHQCTVYYANNQPVRVIGIPTPFTKVDLLRCQLKSGHDREDPTALHEAQDPRVPALTRTWRVTIR